MKAKNIGRIFRISGRFLCGAGKAAAGLLKMAARVLFWLLFVVFAAVFLFLWFDEAGTCFDLGGVWDGNEKRCRCDCLKWTAESGCIPLPDGQHPGEKCMRAYGQ